MLLVGFVEEGYFRGLLLQPLRSKGALHAVIINSVLFGVAHSLGLAFAALVLVTRLIWPLILAHGLINFTATLNSAAGATLTTVRAADYWLAGGLLLFGAAYAAFLLRRYPQPSPVSA